MANEFHKQDAEQLKTSVNDMREKLRNFRFGGAGSRSKNVREGRNLRRDIARALTEIRAKDLPTQTKSAKIASVAKKA